MSTLMFCTRLIDFLLAALFTDQIPDPDILCRSDTATFLSWPHFAAQPGLITIAMKSKQQLLGLESLVNMRNDLRNR